MLRSDCECDKERGKEEEHRIWLMRRRDEGMGKLRVLWGMNMGFA
jgi:hypothetical protein